MSAGILFPESTIFSRCFSVLSVLVAINTVIYVAPGVAKILPRFSPGEWVPRRYTRGQTRSIHPDADDPGPRGS